MNNNHTCLVCLGSNLEARFHLENAHTAFVRLFHEVRMGAIVKTVAEGDIIQPDYLNQAARFTTELGSEEVKTVLKSIEKENGRKPEDKQNGSVPLDIDLLIYDDKQLKPSDLSKTYVQLALQQLTD